MKAKVQFIFDNIDNSLYTPEKASVYIELEVDNRPTLMCVAEHMCRVLQADRYVLGTVLEDNQERY